MNVGAHRQVLCMRSAGIRSAQKRLRFHKITRKFIVQVTYNAVTRTVKRFAGTDIVPCHVGSILALTVSLSSVPVESRKALYKFRHAVRLTHLEYQSNPDLCQVTLLK